jgi:O-antigen ligase
LYVSIIFSQDKINSFVYLYQYVCGLGLFFIAASLSEKERLLTIQTILLAGLAVSFFAIYQYFWGPKHILEYLSASNLSPQFVLDYLQRRRAFSPFVTPGALGGFLAMILLLALTSKNRFWFILIVFPVFFLTKSPSVFLSLLLALMIYFSVQGKIKKSRVFALWALFFLLLVIVFLRFMTQKTYLQPTFSAMMRLSYWREALILIKAHPFIGMGPGNFNLENSRFAHNSYLQIWAEMGIFGLFSLIGLIGVIFKSCLRDLKQSLYKRQIAGLLAASAVFLIHNFLDFTFFLPEVSLIWWLILGLIAGL